MKKIPTIFERDWDGDRSRVLNQPVPGCEWVFEGEGAATRKYDGTAVAVIEGRLFKRHEVRAGKDVPPGFLTADRDEKENRIGWIPAGDGPEDKWLREAAAAYPHETLPFPATTLSDGTYELVGPKVQGNPEQFEQHTLLPHAFADTYDVARDYESLAAFLGEHDIEGLVFHHPDGRMAKIKKRDFGLKR